MNQLFRKVLAAAVLAIGITGAAEQASAISIQEIITMAGQGLNDDVLVTIINSAEDLPELTDEDIAKLENAGITQRVIQTIKNRHPAPAQPAEETPAQPGEDAQTESSNDNNAETSEDDEDSSPQVAVVGDETILAPVESSNIPLVFRKFFEEAYETYNVQAEVARHYDRLQSDTANERAYDSEVPKVVGYMNMLNENPASTLESCLALSDSMNPPPDTLLGAVLNQCIGLALRELKAPAMASVYLDRALQSKAHIRDYSKTLSAFLETAHASDYTSTDPLKFKAHIDEVAAEEKSAFLYFISYSLVYGISPDTKLARQFLSNIPKTSPYYPKSRILLAAIAVRAPEFRFKTAAEHLTEAIQMLKDSELPEAYELTNTAWLALARIAYENRAFDMADEFYQHVDINSHHLKDAMLENAWGQLFAGNHTKALSITHALRAPIFEKAWLPDVLLIEASAYLGLCRYDMANHAIDAFRATTLSYANRLNAYIAEVPARDFYNQILQHANSANASPIPGSIYHRVLSDYQFRTLHKTIRLLGNERRELSQNAGTGFSSLGKLQAIYDDSIQKRQQIMAAVLSKIYDKTLSELHELDISASQIAIEIKLAERKREADCLKIVAAGGTCDTSSNAPKNASFEKRESDAYWKFDGEFWRDELRSYVSGMTSLCK